MTISLRGYDSWKTAAPDPFDQPDEDSMNDAYTDDRMALLSSWLNVASATEVRLARSMIKRREEQLEREAKLTLQELGRTQAPRSDRGKPRKRAAAANDTTVGDPDPFEVSR